MHRPEQNTGIDTRWPQNGLEKVPVCPVCGETRRETLYEGLTDRVFLCAPGEWTLHRCLGCRSAYLDPRPTVDTIALAYRQYFTHESPLELAASEPGVGHAGLKTRLRNGYLNDRYQLALKPASALWRLTAPWFSMRRTGIDLQLHPLTPPFPGARLLDVGSGNGAFLRLAIRIGWDAEGLEPDPSAAATARAAGLPVHEGQLPATGLPSDHFDGVTMTHVIEHLHDPMRSLREVYRILAPGGRLWIATPNLESPLHRRFRRNWRALEPPRHLVLFNLRSLTYACREAGFDAITSSPRSRSAVWITAASLRIRSGEVPVLGPFPKLKLTDRLRAQCLDTVATRCQQRWSEELGIVATKPAD